MQQETVCDYCNKRTAAHTCEVCGATVCEIHKKDRGCSVCNGGMKTFE